MSAGWLGDRERASQPPNDTSYQQLAPNSTGFGSRSGSANVVLAHKGQQARRRVSGRFPSVVGADRQRAVAGSASGWDNPSRVRPNKNLPGGKWGAAPPALPPSGGSTLGNKTSIASVSDATQLRRAQRREHRFRLREILSDVSSLRRVRACGRRRVPNRDPQIRLKEGVAHFGNVTLCGNVWSCPTCSPRIRHERALEVDRACREWIAAHGKGSVLLLTLTMPHDWGEPLSETLLTVREANRAVWSGRARNEERELFGLAHFIRVHDCTVGPNGWHPHIHALLFTERVLKHSEMAAVRQRLHLRWVSAIVRRGRRAPSSEFGTELEAAQTVPQVSRYVAQVVGGDSTSQASFEIMRGDLKRSRIRGHRTPWQVLEDFAAFGDEADLHLFNEWEQATRGVHAMQWSRGLRERMGVAHKSDDEIVAEEIGAEVVSTRGFADHHAYDEDEVARVVEDAARLQAEPVTTRKDWVRLPEAARVMIAPIDIDLVFADEEAVMHRLAGLRRG